MPRSPPFFDAARSVFDSFAPSATLDGGKTLGQSPFMREKQKQRQLAGKYQIRFSTVGDAKPETKAFADKKAALDFIAHGRAPRASRPKIKEFYFRQSTFDGRVMRPKHADTLDKASQLWRLLKNEEQAATDERRLDSNPNIAQ